MVSPTDNELFGRFREGDELALNQLRTRFQPKLDGYFRKRLPASEIDDLCQDVWLRAIKSAGTFDPQRSFRSWLWTIAAHAVTNHRHKSIRFRRGSTSFEGFDPGPDPADAAAMSEELATVRHAMRRLPPLQHAIVEKVYFHHQPLKKVADREGISFSVARARMCRAMRTLRKRLA